MLCTIILVYSQRPSTLLFMKKIFTKIVCTYPLSIVRLCLLFYLLAYAGRHSAAYGGFAGIDPVLDGFTITRAVASGVYNLSSPKLSDTKPLVKRNAVVCETPTLHSNEMPINCTDITRSFTLNEVNGATGYALGNSGGHIETQASVTFTDVPPGNYTVTAIFDGCESEPLVVIVPSIVFPNIPTVLGFASQPSCGILGSFQVTPVDGVIGYELNDNAQTENTFGNLGSGTHYVKAVNTDGCKSDALAVTMDPLPFRPDKPQLAEDIHQPTCTVSTGSFTVHSSSGGYLYLSGSNVGTMQTETTFSDLAPGRYYLAVLGNLECDSEELEIIIHEQPLTPEVPVLSGNIAQPTCDFPKGTFTLSPDTKANRYQYAFIDPTTGDGTPVDQEFAYFELNPGNYKIWALSEGGCRSELEEVLIERSKVVPDTPELTVIEPTCATNTGTITIINGDSGYTYDWGDGTNSQTLTSREGLAPASYYEIFAISGDNCRSIAAAKVTLGEWKPKLPVVSVGPQPMSVCEGEQALFSADVTGDTDDPDGEQLSFQWEYSDGNDTWHDQTDEAGKVSGATTNFLTIITDASIPGARQWRLVISNDCGSVTTVAASLTITRTPVITTQPTDQSLCPGTSATATFSVTATGDNLTYQWMASDDEENWYAVLGSDENVISISEGTITFNGVVPGRKFKLKITNKCTLISESDIVIIHTIQPQKPTVVLTQPTCALATGIIQIDYVDDDYTYSLTGPTPSSGAGLTLSGLTSGEYSLTATSDDCQSSPLAITIDPAPGISDPEMPIYVKSGGTGMGASWACASGNLQAAIDAAASGQQVWVAGGTYQLGSGHSFSIKNGVKIYGGFAGTETDLASRNLDGTNSKSILQGNGGPVIYFTNASQSTVLDGFTISGGAASGLINVGSSPMLVNLIITGNSGGGQGGGITNLDESSPTLINSVIHNNEAANGGGIANYNGSQPMIINCTIADNDASDTGGGIYNSGNSSHKLYNSIVYGNSSGITNDNSSFATIKYSLVQGETNLNSEDHNTPGDVDPLFENAEDGDYHLKACSPVIDQGNDFYITSQTPAITADLGNNLRKSGKFVDMGAYEFAGTSSELAVNGDWVTDIISANLLLISNGSTCKAVAYLSPNGAHPVSGEITAKVWVEGVQPVNFLKRHYEITPTTDAENATARITLYFTQQEFTDFNEVNAIPLPVDAEDTDNYKAHLLIEKRSGVSRNGSGLPGTYDGSVATINPLDPSVNGSILWNAVASRWEVSFDVTGFSGFFVKTTDTVLPLQLISFTASKETGSNLLQWKTTSEVNTYNFEVQSSMDAKTFNKIATVNANGSGNHLYSYQDTAVKRGNVYYRLKMNDTDGTFAYSKIISLRGDGADNTSIYPNPAGQAVTIHVNTALLKSTAALYHVSGRLLQSFVITTSQQEIPVKSLASGVYILRFADGTAERFVKE